MSEPAAIGDRIGGSTMMLANRFAIRISWRPRPRGVSSSSWRGESLGESRGVSSMELPREMAEGPAPALCKGPRAEMDEEPTRLS